jgi:hypothetical protein
MHKTKSPLGLIAGLALIGCLSWALPAVSAEAPETWSVTGSMGTSRRHATITQLPNGKTLVVGGVDTTGVDLSGSVFSSSAELYDPIAGTWTSTGSLTTGGRALHTATLLGNGKVLIAGGWDGTVSLNTAELYDPATGLFTQTKNNLNNITTMTAVRSQHTATLLDNGKVLIAGGWGGGPLASSELFDPVSGVFTAPTGSTPSLTDARNTHTATRLPSGKVLIVGGYGAATTLATAELFDPASEAFSSTGSLSQGRGSHRAGILTNGKVLVTGGNNGGSLSSAELYNPNAGTFSAAGSLSQARQWHNGALLPNGQVLISGGNNNASSHWDIQTSFLSSAELYDPITNAFTSTGTMTTSRSAASRQVLWTGRDLVAAGGSNTAELYCPAMPGTPEQWTKTGKLNTARTGAQATVLDNGNIFISGGTDMTAGDASTAYASNELYDYMSGTFSSAGIMNTPRHQHGNVRLPSGNVLITGGQDASLSSALATSELYDPVTGTYTFTGGTGLLARRLHRVTLLANGNVLVTGGISDGGGTRASARLYDYTTGLFSATTIPMTEPRRSHRATRLFDGRVLIVGGRNSTGILSSAELYDPDTKSFSATGSMAAARSSPRGTRLPDGRVLISGGIGTGNNAVLGTELYDPSTGTFTSAGNSAVARESDRGTLLDNGTVLFSGGISGENAGFVTYASTELYDVASGTFVLTGNLQTARQDHSSSPLPNGQTLVAGGVDSSGNALASAELYSVNICIGDTDGDGIPNYLDNAPLVYNPGQSDTDGDGIGDDVDNCPDVANPDQLDSDGNGLGNACDDKTVVANFTVPPPPAGVPQGDPVLVNVTFTIDGSFSGYVVKPTCENVVHEIRGSDGLVPMREFYNVVNIPNDLVPVVPGQQFILTCDLNNLASPGALLPDSYTYNASIVNQVVDPDIDATGACTYAPCFPNIFTGQIESNSLTFKVAAPPSDRPPTMSVQMDIKFGTFPNDLNPDKKGITPVVIFGSPELDVKNIDVASLRLSGARVSSKNKGGLDVSYVDKDGDGIVDLDVKFVTPTRKQLHLVPGQVDAIAVLTGNLTDGTPITASDSIRIVKQ